MVVDDPKLITEQVDNGTVIENLLAFQAGRQPLHQLLSFYLSLFCPECRLSSTCFSQDASLAAPAALGPECVPHLFPSFLVHCIPLVPLPWVRPHPRPLSSPLSDFSTPVHILSLLQ